MLRESASLLFLFQTGSIKSFDPAEDTLNVAGFYSKLVRLKAKTTH